MSELSTHAHVIDPEWDTGPVPWAPGADATLLPRLHAACSDQCGDCMTALAREAAAGADTTAVVVAVAFAIAETMPPTLTAVVRDKLAQNRPWTTVVDLIGDEAAEPSPLAVLQQMGAEDRVAVVEGCAQIIGLYSKPAEDHERR